MLIKARSQVGVPHPPPPSMLVGPPDKQSLTGSPPREDDEPYLAITVTAEGTLTPDRSPQAPRHLSPEEANRPDGYGRTPLSAAVMRGHVDEFRALLAAGATADVRKGGNTLLHEAGMSRNPSSEIVRLLVEECGQDPNALNENGQAPLHLAAHSGTSDMFNVLVQFPNTLLDIRSKRIDPYTRDKQTRQTPLHVLAAGRRQQGVDMSQMLLQPSNGKIPADIYAEDAYKKTPLEMAIQTGSEMMVRVLLHYTSLGHKSVSRAYAICNNDTIKALFEERSDVVPKPSAYSHIADIPNGATAAEPSSASSSDDDSDSDDPLYVHTSELFKKEE